MAVPTWGDGSADAAALRLSGVVASVLSLCAPSCLAAGSANGASLQGEMTSPDCPLTKKSAKQDLQRLLELSTMSNSCTAPIVRALDSIRKRCWSQLVGAPLRR